MKIEGIIFDWAGTTVDFGSFAPVQAFIEAFKEFGITPTVEEVRKPMGMLKIDHIRTMLSMERSRICGLTDTEKCGQKRMCRRFTSAAKIRSWKSLKTSRI